MQISEALGITPFEILGYIDEGRLSIVKGHFEKIED